MAACSPKLALRGKRGVDRVGFMHPVGVVSGPGRPVKDIPKCNTAPATGRVCATPGSNPVLLYLFPTPASVLF